MFFGGIRFERSGDNNKIFRFSEDRVTIKCFIMYMNRFMRNEFIGDGGDICPTSSASIIRK